jgi:hypothetical protein
VPSSQGLLPLVRQIRRYAHRPLAWFGLCAEDLVVLSMLADDVFVGMPLSGSDPDDPSMPEDPLVVGDALTRLLQMGLNEPDAASSRHAEEVVSLRLEEIRDATPSVLGRSTAVPVSIAGHTFSLPLKLGRRSAREAAGGMVAVTLSGVDLPRVTPNCVLFTDEP